MLKTIHLKKGTLLLLGGMVIGEMMLGGIGCGSQTTQEVGVSTAAVTSETSPEGLESSAASPPPEAASTAETSSTPSSTPVTSPAQSNASPPVSTAPAQPADGSTPAATPAPPAQLTGANPTVQPAAVPAPQRTEEPAADGLFFPHRRELFGLFNDVAAHRFHVVQLHPRRGGVDSIASFQFQRMSLPTALGPRKQLFFFVGDHRLHAVHTGTGRVLREIPIPSWVKGVTSMESDDRGDILYALFNTAEGHKLTAIHVISGRVDVIAHLPVGPVGLNSALDPDRGRYFFASTRGFYAVDTRSGRILVTSSLPSWVRGVTSMEFDEDRKILYGLLNTEKGHVFAKLNPETGGVEIIAHLPVDRIGVMNSALDTKGDRYFFAGAGHLYTVDTRTGRVEANVSIPTYIVSLAF